MNAAEVLTEVAVVEGDVVVAERAGGVYGGIKADEGAAGDGVASVILAHARVDGRNGRADAFGVVTCLDGVDGLPFGSGAGHFIAEDGKGFDCRKIKAFCREKGLAFFDTASRVCRLKGNASDAFLVILRPADISGMLEKMPLCRTIVTTGGKSSDEFIEILDSTGLTGVTRPPMGGFTDICISNRNIRWWRMPSSSRAYPMKLESKVALYRKVFECTGTSVAAL